MPTYTFVQTVDIQADSVEEAERDLQTILSQARTNPNHYVLQNWAWFSLKESVKMYKKYRWSLIRHLIRCVRFFIFTLDNDCRRECLDEIRTTLKFLKNHEVMN